MSISTPPLTTPVTTMVRFRLDAPTPSGLVPLTGPWRFTPSRRLIASDHIIVPSDLEVMPSASETAAGYFLLALPATDTTAYGPAWGWTVTEPRPGITQTILVPTSTQVLEYAGLVSVDAHSLAPTAIATAAWTVTQNQLAARVTALEIAQTENVNTVSYNGFVNLVTTMFTTFTTQLTNLTSRIAALEAGATNNSAGNVVMAYPATYASTY